MVLPFQITRPPVTPCLDMRDHSSSGRRARRQGKRGKAKETSVHGSMPNAILAVDCGTTGLKATLVSRDGRTLATSVSDYRNATASAPGGIVEQLPADWWHAMQQAVAELLLRAEGDSIAAISLSGQMQDLIFVRNDGTVLGPAILYSDSRATEEAAAIEAKIGKDRLCIETGNWKGPLSLLPKLLWCQKHRPEDLASSDAILLGSHSFLALMLCGRAVGDRVTASTTGLLRADGTNYCNDIINEVLPPGDMVLMRLPLDTGQSVKLSGREDEIR